MQSILQQLPDDQCVLLMYLADELPASDREIVERRLAADESLRDQLEMLRAAHEMISGEIRQIDQTLSTSPNSQASLRQVTRSIRQWQVDRARQEVSVPAQSGRASWWLYPAGAAVAAIIVYTVWWGFQPAEPSSLRSPGQVTVTDPWAGGRESFTQIYNPIDDASLNSVESDLDQVVMLRTMTQ
jgi:anti-sigma factor RsiW